MFEPESISLAVGDRARITKNFKESKQEIVELPFADSQIVLTLSKQNIAASRNMILRDSPPLKSGLV